MKLRTLGELQARIIFLEERLDKILNLENLNIEQKKAIQEFENKTIYNLKAQLNFRINNYLNLVGLK